jgi:hypothetical protein
MEDITQTNIESKDTVQPSFVANFFGRPTQVSPPQQPLTLTTLAQVKDNIIYNWSGIHPIAKKARLQMPKNEEEVSRLVRMTKGKVRI